MNFQIWHFFNRGSSGGGRSSSVQVQLNRFKGFVAAQILEIIRKIHTCEPEPEHTPLLRLKLLLLLTRARYLFFLYKHILHKRLLGQSRDHGGMKSNRSLTRLIVLLLLLSSCVLETRAGNCPKGKYGNKGKNNKGCKECKRGFYGDQNGLKTKDQCKKCGTGRYSDLKGIQKNDQCKNCNKGRWSDQTGITSNGACKTCR